VVDRKGNVLHIGDWVKVHMTAYPRFSKEWFVVVDIDTGKDADLLLVSKISTGHSTIVACNQVEVSISCSLAGPYRTITHEG